MATTVVKRRLVVLAMALALAVASMGAIAADDAAATIQTGCGEYAEFEQCYMK